MSTWQRKVLPAATGPDSPHFSHSPREAFHCFSALGFDPATHQYVVSKTWVPSHVHEEEEEPEDEDNVEEPEDDDDVVAEELLSTHMVLRFGACESRRNLDREGPIESTVGGSISVDGAIFFLTVDKKCHTRQWWPSFSEQSSPTSCLSSPMT
ncbi:Acyl carrier protein [Psidium guajava]|nr:Acyl carrier protein [Psidium guajava]